MEPFDCIYISWGGIHGIVYLGILKYLDEMKLLQNVRRWIGCSVGSIISLLYIIGMTTEEIIYEFCELKYKDYMSLTDISQIQNLFYYPHMFSILSWDDTILKFLFYILEKKNIYKYITLEELYKQTNKDYYLLTYNLTDKNSVYLNHSTNPKLFLIDAIKMSCSAPIIYGIFRYEGKDYIDGALCGEIPYQLFDNKTCVMHIFYDTNDHSENMYSFFLFILYNYINRCMKIQYDLINHKNVEFLYLEYKKDNVKIFDIKRNDVIDMIYKGYLTIQTKWNKLE